jgi:hypothetical protein
VLLLLLLLLLGTKHISMLLLALFLVSNPTGSSRLPPLLLQVQPTVQLVLQPLTVHWQLLLHNKQSATTSPYTIGSCWCPTTAAAATVTPAPAALA